MKKTLTVVLTTTETETTTEIERNGMSPYEIIGIAEMLRVDALREIIGTDLPKTDINQEKP